MVLRDGRCLLNKAVTVVGQAFLLAGVGALIGLGFNLVRPQGLALVADGPYQIYAPCPERFAKAELARVKDLPQELGAWLVLDARPVEEYTHAHVPGARSFPYDVLRPPAPEALAGLRQVRARGILVYGDAVIDSGRRLAGELTGVGLRGVRYLEGGFPAWVQAGRPVAKGGGG